MLGLGKFNSKRLKYIILNHNNSPYPLIWLNKMYTVFFRCQENNTILCFLMWRDTTRISYMARALSYLSEELFSICIPLPHYFPLPSTVTISKRQYLLCICGLLFQFNLLYISINSSLKCTKKLSVLSLSLSFLHMFQCMLYNLDIYYYIITVIFTMFGKIAVEIIKLLHSLVYRNFLQFFRFFLVSSVWRVTRIMSPHCSQFLKNIIILLP